MIESGSHTPGVSVAAFGLPPHTAVRYERPDPALAGYIIDYHVLDSESSEAWGSVEWMLPGWSAIRIALVDHPISLKLGDTVYDPMPVAALYGTTTRAMRITSHGGVTIGAVISPLGWSRLFAQPANRYRDRIVPLDAIMAPVLVEELVASLAASDRGRDVKGVLDDFFLRHMGPPDRNEADIRALMALVVDDATIDLSLAAEKVGINERRLRRLSTRYFGFPPKTLLLRRRFLRSFLAMFMARDHADYSLIASSYHDASHFLRDAKRFLGMTPRRFMAMKTPYLDAVLRARRVVFGASTSALDETEPQ